MSDKEKELRKRLAILLKGGESHMSFNDAVSDFPEKDINTFPQNVPYSFWHLVEHIRRGQADLLEFISDPDYKDKNWPEDFWPGKDEKADKKDWDKTIDGYNSDLDKLVKIVNDPETDLYDKIKWGDGQIILREILMVADHTVYHVGEFAILRQVSNNWPPGHR